MSYTEGYLASGILVMAWAVKGREEAEGNTVQGNRNLLCFCWQDSAAWRMRYDSVSRQSDRHSRMLACFLLFYFV